MDRRRNALIAVAVGFVVLAAVPVVVTFGLGWLHLPAVQPSGKPAVPDATPPEAWALFAVLYGAWLVALTIGLVWANDRIGYHWQPPERERRPSKKERRRRAATMSVIGAEQEARVAAELRRRKAKALAGGPDGAAGPGNGGKGGP